jgi:hypothetical protein
MPEQATALLALWNDVDPALDAQYNAWHAGEHVPERLTVPGILWGRRYGRSAEEGSPRYLTLYGLRDADVLEGEPYQRLLREPTATSRTMRPALRNVSRWVCALHEQSGLDEGTHLLVWISADDRLPASGDNDPPVHGLVAHGRLLAQRLPEARPLPWLQAAQDQGIDGRWLVCVPVDGVRSAGPIAGAGLYARLPVGLPALP